ncbi:MAG: YqjD family protein [Povalibacter sp.]
MSTEVTTDQLIEDLKTVVQDAEALLKATSAQTGEKIQEVRARAEESLRQAKERVTAVEQEALRRAREIADATEEYVRDNPWQSIGIAAGVGLVLGLLVSRR